MGWRQASGIEKTGTNPRQAHLGDRPRGPSLNVYLDTSALLKLYIDEEGTTSVRALVDAANVIGTSLITWVEAHAALARRRRRGDLSASDHRRAVRELVADWERYVRLQVTDVLVREAARLADTHGLRAYDSVHLASARALRARLVDPTAFVSWDEGLDSAAEREGFSIVGRG